MQINLRRIVLAIMFIAFGAVALSSGARATVSPPSGQCNGNYNCNRLEITDESNTANAGASANASAQSDSTGVGVGIGEGGDAYAGGGTGVGVSGVDSSGNSSVSNRSRNTNSNSAEGGTAVSRNTNDNRATGGEARADSQVNGSGNSRNSNVAQGGTGGQASLDVRDSGNSSASNTSNSDIYVEGDTDNSSYEFVVPSYAAAGYSNNLIVDCQRIIGFDFRGSGTTQARGASFGIPLPGGACKLEKATLYAFDLGNYKLGWMLYCAQKPVWKGYRETAQAITGMKLDKQQAIVQCFDTAKIAVGKSADMSRYATKEQVERAFVTSQSK